MSNASACCSSSSSSNSFLVSVSVSVSIPVSVTDSVSVSISVSVSVSDWLLRSSSRNSGNDNGDDVEQSNICLHICVAIWKTGTHFASRTCGNSRCFSLFEHTLNLVTALTVMEISLRFHLHLHMCVYVWMFCIYFCVFFILLLLLLFFDYTPRYSARSMRTFSSTRGL